MPIRALQWFRKSAKSPAKATAKPSPIKDYGAVEIELNKNGCCNDAKRLEGRRFLMTQAPPLPLPGCTQKRCDCRFLRFDDRRQDARRDADVGITSRIFMDEDRRTKRGRRKTDQDN